MLKPRLKSAFPPLPLEAGTDRQVWQLMRLMDGSRTTEQICAAMRDKDPRLTDEEVRALLEQLIGAGYVEDAAVFDRFDAGFDVDELERYRRDVELFGFFNHPPLSGHDYRMRLRESRVTVVGVGGLGSYAALGLATAGVGELLLVDDGDVSPECLQRQALYTEADLGKPRVEAAAERLGRVNPDADVATASNVDDCAEWLRGRDLLVCADRRFNLRTNGAALAERVPWLLAADDGLVAGMFLYVPGQTACFECERRSAASPATVPGYGDNPCSAPASALIGSMAALEAVKFLSGAMEPATLGRRLIFDLRTMNIRFQEGVRYADCVRCSDSRDPHGVGDDVTGA